MKKILVILLGVLLTFSVTFAQVDPEKQPKGGPDDMVITAVPTAYAGEDAEMKSDEETNQSKGNKTGPVTTINGTQVHAGLYNALSNVKNENARASLERNMARFLERYQAKLAKASNVTVEVDEETQEMTIKAKKEVKYLGFIKGSATDKMKVDKSGKINEKKPWYRFMYTESQPEE